MSEAVFKTYGRIDEYGDWTCDACDNQASITKCHIVEATSCVACGVVILLSGIGEEEEHDWHYYRPGALYFMEESLSD